MPCFFAALVSLPDMAQHQHRMTKLPHSTCWMAKPMYTLCLANRYPNNCICSARDQPDGLVSHQRLPLPQAPRVQVHHGTMPRVSCEYCDTQCPHRTKHSSSIICLME